MSFGGARRRLQTVWLKSKTEEAIAELLPLAQNYLSSARV